MTDNQFSQEPREPLHGFVHRIPPQPGTTTMGQGAEDDAAATVAYEPGEPVVEVPEDAIAVDTDVTVADELVAYTPDGTVIDTREVGTVITTSDGVRITIDDAGKLHVDADFENETYVDDESTLAEGAELTTESGTHVARNDEGSVVVTQPNGQILTLHDDGSVDVDLPEHDGSGLGDGLGDGSGALPAGGEEGDEDGAGSAEDEIEEDIEELEDELDDALENEPEAPTVEPTPPPGGGTGPGGGGSGPGGGGSGPGGGGSGPGGGGSGTDGGGGSDPGGGGDGNGNDNGNDNGNGTDFTVTTGDLRTDGRYFEGLAPTAGALAGCWESMGSLIQHWGLWGFAQGPFTEACSKFATLHQDGSEKLEHIGRDLHASADDYDEAELQGVAAADQIAR